MLWPSRNVQDHQNRINGNQQFPNRYVQYFRYFSQKVTLFWSKNQERLTSFAGVSWNFPKSSQLWGAVSPSSMNIFWWDRCHCKGLCLNFNMSLIRSKTGAWPKSYAQWKTRDFRENRFHIPTCSVWSNAVSGSWGIGSRCCCQFELTREHRQKVGRVNRLDFPK